MNRAEKKLADLDRRIATERQKLNEKHTAQQQAASQVARIERDLIEAEARRAVGQATDRDVQTVERTLREAKQQVEDQRDVQIATRSVELLEQERGEFVLKNAEGLQAGLHRRLTETHTATVELARNLADNLEAARGLEAEANQLTAATNSPPPTSIPQVTDELRRALRRALDEGVPGASLDSHPNSAVVEAA